ncbi:hypothetical protein JOQ06_015675 [Pogonophryne albipinna]|uniref:Uncharacterized protein n=1 Tax=Pogonophryne albipinna TaxID=1090488 RepID=A0AAD6AMM9_9TELE|nr:hypothetical protein JOQ06_015675 [Pogonophryne albipinna]
MTASPLGVLPVVVVGDGALIIPQNPSQMSPSLGGRWAGAPPLPHRVGAGSSSNLLGITFNSQAFPGTAGRGAAICPACCASEEMEDSKNGSVSEKQNEGERREKRRQRGKIEWVSSKE